MNQAAIKNLIVEAVDRVLVTRQEDISRAERERVIQESREKFEDLIREKVGEERERARRHEEELRAREQEVSLLSKELASLREEGESLNAARERAEEEKALLSDRLAQLEEQLSGAVGEAEGEAARLREELESARAELNGAREELEARESVREEAETLRAEEARLTEELAAARGELEEKETNGGEVETLRAAVERLTRELAVSLEKVAERDSEIERYRGDIDRLTNEIDRHRQGPSVPVKESSDNVGVMELTGMFRELLYELKTNADKQGKQQANELKESMALLADRISKGLSSANSGGGGGFAGVGDPAEDVMAAFFALENKGASLETNLGKVETKKTQAKKGVAGSLEKLKSMQKSGGNQGGS